MGLRGWLKLLRRWILAIALLTYRTVRVIVTAVSGVMWQLVSVTESFNRAIWRSIRTVFDGLLDRIYRAIPSREGTLDSELQEETRRHLLFIGIRFRTFNDYVGGFVGGGLLFVLTPVLVVVGIDIMGIVPSNVVGDILIGILVFLVVIGVLLLAVANMLVLLYFGAVLRFIIRRARASLEVTESFEKEMYHFQVDDETGENDLPAGSEHRLYKGNLRAFIRSSIYGLFILGITVAYYVYPNIVASLSTVIETFPMEEAKNLPVVDYVGNMVRAVDLLLPFDVDGLLRPSILEALFWLVVLICIFEIFLNIKKVVQHARLSKYDLSEYDEFTAGGEFRQYKLLVGVVLYQLLHGDLQEDYELILGDFFGLVGIIFIDFALTYIIVVGGLGGI